MRGLRPAPRGSSSPTPWFIKAIITLMLFLTGLSLYIMTHDASKESDQGEQTMSTRHPKTDLPKILILTPVKNLGLNTYAYFQRLLSLTYPHHLISVGLLEGDSSDQTLEELTRHMTLLNPAVLRTAHGERKRSAGSSDFRSITLLKKDYSFELSRENRHADEVQYQRRIILSKSRNHLLYSTLRDEDWVLWIDSDVYWYPQDIIQTLLATKLDIVTPNCVISKGARSYDLNSFVADRPDDLTHATRQHLADFRGQDSVELTGVGATMLLVRADIHREGLHFPTFIYRTVMESEALAYLARDMGYHVYGLPDVEIYHS